MSALEHCVTRYHKAPQYSTVFRYLITKEDANLLQKGVQHLVYMCLMVFVSDFFHNFFVCDQLAWLQVQT